MRIRPLTHLKRLSECPGIGAGRWRSARPWHPSSGLISFLQYLKEFIAIHLIVVKLCLLYYPVQAAGHEVILFLSEEDRELQEGRGGGGEVGGWQGVHRVGRWR